MKHKNSSQKLVVLGMGGTIAGTASNPEDNVGYRAAQVSVAQLLSDIPSLSSALVGHQLVSEQVAQVDSKDMRFVEWIALAQRVSEHLSMPDVTGIVITHGTDTLEETAFFLSQVLPMASLVAKPVVMTCAMRPASSLSPDGPQNILDAVAVSCSEGANGVLVVCAGVLHTAADVQKVHPYRMNAFDSGEAGPLGFVEEGALRLVRDWPRLRGAPTAISAHDLQQVRWPRVEILVSFVGASGATVRTLCAERSATEDAIDGIVVAGTGNGTIHADLEAALREAQAQGVKVVRTTRCSLGQIVPPATPTDGLPHLNGLSPVKARIALILSLLAKK